MKLLLPVNRALKSIKFLGHINRRRKICLKGFTLIEILIVVAIIGILAAIVIINLDNAQARSRDSRRKSDLNTIAKAAQLYRQDKGTYIIRNASNNGGANNAGYGLFNCGSDSSCGAGYATVYSGPSINKTLIDYGYLSGVIKDPAGGVITTDKGYYTYDWSPNVVTPEVGTLKASIWCVLEDSSTIDSATLKNSIYAPAGTTFTQAELNNINRVIFDTRINYAVTLIP